MGSEYTLGMYVARSLLRGNWSAGMGCGGIELVVRILPSDDDDADEVEVTGVVDVEVVLVFGLVRKVEVTILSEMGWMLSSDVVLEIGALVTGVVGIELPSGVEISSVIIFSAIIEAIID